MSDQTEPTPELSKLNPCQQHMDVLGELEPMCPVCLIGERNTLSADLAQARRERDEAVAKLEAATQPDGRPKIVCICGSSRFADVAAVKQWEYAKQGVLALGMHLLPSWYEWNVADGQTPHPDGGHGAELEGVAAILDELHLRKIDMADEVFVVNVGGYIGERTAIEIDYALQLGKPVSYMEAGEGVELSQKGGDASCPQSVRASRAVDTIHTGNASTEAGSNAAPTFDQKAAAELEDFNDRLDAIPEHPIARLRAEVEELREDKAMLDWLIAREAYVSWSRDREVCNVWFRWDDDGQDGGPVEGYPQKCHDDPREAIRAAMRKEGQ